MESVDKPWGHYTDIYRPDDKKVVFKKIVVDAGEQLSMQYHKGRTEFWYVTSGKGLITTDNPASSLYVKEGDYIVIKPLERHMVENIGEEPLEIFEMQAGVCEEDDIIRLSDKYGRE
tara:strand:+ start:135 stop:485 length:351 start_codon:yes stop_codon:yes gene_type:complete